MFFRKVLLAFGFICLCHFDNSSSYAEQSIASAASLPAPRVHLKFDGDLENAGTQPRLAPRMFTSDGRISRQVPNFVDGTAGQALRFAGGRSVDIPLDVFLGAFPKVTFTAWIYAEPDFGNGAGHIVSNNSYLSLYYYAGQLWMTTDRAHTIRFTSLETVQPEEWVFVAGVWNATDGTATLFVNGESKSATFNPANDLSPDRSVWLGAQHANKSTIRDMRMDDVRIYDTALTIDQLSKLYSGVTQTAQNIEDDVQPSEGLEGPLERTEPVDEAVLGDNPLSDANPATRDIIAPDNLPNDELEEDVERARNARPQAEPADEIDCETLPTRDSDGFVEMRGAFPQEFVSAVRKLLGCGKQVTVASLNEKNQWIVASADEIAYSLNAPGPLAAKLREYEKQYGGLTAGDIAENGAWLINADENYAYASLPSSLQSALSSLEGRTALTSIDFHPRNNNQWVAVKQDGSVLGSSIPTGAQDHIAQKTATKRQVRQFKYGAGGSWVLLTSHLWFASRGLDSVALERLKRSRRRTGLPIDHVVFTSAPGAFMKIANGPEMQVANDRAQQIEQSIGGTNIWQRMDNYNLSGVSIAMIRNNQVVWARGYGLRKKTDAESYVRPDTTFEAASLSKPIAAFAAMQLVEDGKMSLTQEGVLQDVEALIAWPNRGAFRDRIKPQAGNLAQVLQHCASICYERWDSCANDGSGGGAATYNFSDPLPTIAQMIRGAGRASRDHRLLRTGNPGVKSEYSSANYILVQALIDVHSGDYASYMEALLDDFEMTNSTFISPYRGANSGNFARGWNGSSVTNVVAYGETAAAGLVSTPADYAKFIITINKQGGGHLSPDHIDFLLGRDTTEWGKCRRGSSQECAISVARKFCMPPDSMAPNSMALGIRHSNSHGSWGGNEVFFHGGLQNGYRLRMVGLPQINAGLVVFITGTERASDPNPNDNNSPPLRADQFFIELRSAVVQAYGL